MDTENNQNSFSLSLSESSIKEVIILLSDIDVKITALNESSAKDFLNLNKNLKGNYKVAELISGNATKLFIILSGKDRNYLLNQLESYHTGLKIQIDNFINYVTAGARILETIQAGLNTVFVPVKNFNQNLMTLSFLLANLKLNLIYLSKQDDVVEKIDNLIQEIRSTKEGYDLLESKINKLKVLVQSVFNFFNNLKEEQDITLESLLEQIKSSVTILSAKHQEASVQMPILTKKTEDYFANVSSIITNLQFHDIIRQKMEHVQQTHKEIISELNSFDFSDKSTELTESTKKFLRIRDIASVQVAQLIHTNQEYQEAIEKITKNFLQIGDDMKSISAMCTSFSGHNFVYGVTHFHKIEKKLEKSVELINKFSSDGETFGKEISSIQDVCNSINDELAGLSNSNKIISNSVIDIFKILDDSDVKLPGLKKLKLQIVDVNTNVLEELELIKSHYVDVSDELESIGTIVEEDYELEFKTNLHKISDSIYSIVKVLNKDNSEVESLLDQNRKYGNRLAMDIQTSIEKVKYYDFFEQVIEKIIIQLNNIYQTIKADSDEFGIENEDDLQSIKERYTMDSQRDIHDKIMLNGDAPAEVEDDEDDIEFF
ncbi:MAG: hypothetical protein B6I20_08440 [Bacteroidetes bacterium 4572_117]|nr:MAG: hypothetical protein B6I20_08440 [Bacteroidetes bacterium 4572_117]